MADPTFTSRLSDVQEYCQTIADYLSGDGSQRLWMVPNEAGWTFDPTSIADLGVPFDRAQLNQDYENVLADDPANDSDMKELMSTHIQLGYLSVMERAFRARHQTSTRAYGFVQGRKLAHGDSTDGVHLGSVRQHIIDIETIS